MTRPWGIHTLGQMFGGYNGPQAGLPNGRYVQAVTEPYRPEGLIERLRIAWWVFSGRAHAVIWPEAGDLERIMWGDKMSAGSGGTAPRTSDACGKAKP